MNIPTPNLDSLVLNPSERPTLAYARGRSAIHADANAYVAEMARHNEAAAKTIGRKAAALWVPQLKEALIQVLGGKQVKGNVVFVESDGTERIAKY